MVASAFRAVVLTVSVSLLFSCGINNIPTLSEAVNLAWSEVQAQYKRRANLVPQLFDALQPIAVEEDELLKRLNETRANVEQTNVSPETLNDKQAFNLFERNQSAFSHSLDQVLLTAQNYPSLLELPAFQAITSELGDTEERITVARRDYIQKVERYNSELDSVPGRWWRAFMYSDAHKHETFATSSERDSAAQWVEPVN